ncbi:hypothetical protein MPH_07183 [Macrophomina phaseolina MS6]|uniref:Uncharacterized protein n=1 Tax=Macrophomina phaseolina (strain MS6) TaxID=1126212 RepID=K2RM07_MACPH|nr:hypothetical protein MPH_07183 [Macrophomina phaseolina MS6]
MCCEELHICSHCGYLITSYIDRCRFACSSRNPGTEIGIHADDWCPEGEWIVEEFMHADDGACPKCSNTNLRVFPVDGLSGEVVHPPMTLLSTTKTTPRARGGADPAAPVSPTESDASGAGGDGDGDGEDGAKVAQKSGGFVSGWRKRVRSMVNGTRITGVTTGKRKVSPLQ